MKKNAEEVYSELKEDISTYAELKLELIKLNAYEQTGKVLAVLSYGLVLYALVATAILFILLTLGFLLSEWLHSTIAGFGIVAAIYLLQIVVLILNRNRIRRKIMNVIISALHTNEKNNDAAANPGPEQNNPE